MRITFRHYFNQRLTQLFVLLFQTNLIFFVKNRKHRRLWGCLVVEKWVRFSMNYGLAYLQLKIFQLKTKGLFPKFSRHRNISTTRHILYFCIMILEKKKVPSAMFFCFFFLHFNYLKLLIFSSI